MIVDDGNSISYRRRRLKTRTMKESSRKTTMTQLLLSRSRRLLISLISTVDGDTRSLPVLFFLLNLIKSKRLAALMAILTLLTNSPVMGTCNLKTIADPPWATGGDGVQTVVIQAVPKAHSSNGQNGNGKMRPGMSSSLVVTNITPNEAGGPSPTMASSAAGGAPSAVVAGYPSASGSPHSVSRQRLLQLLNNPAFKRPNMDDLPVHIMIKLIPIKIQDLIEKNEVLETTLRLQLTWQDKRLSWNSDFFHNITEVVIPGNLIWVPDIAIINSVSDLYHVVRDTRFEMKIESNGRIWWHPTGIVKTNCKLFLRYFPFDRQMCKFIFESPTFDLRFMNLTLRSEKSPVDTRMYTDGETWQLLGFSGKNIVNQVGSKTYFARVEFLIRIERARIYHLLNVILPAIFLSTVQVMFFLLPATHPQRVGSSTTTLLSVVVFQTVAVAQLPKTSTDIPLLSIYIFFVIIVSALSVGTSIIVAKFVIYADKRVEIPIWIARIPHPASCWHAIICCLCCCCERLYDHHRNSITRQHTNEQRQSAAGSASARVSVATSPLLHPPNGCNTHIDIGIDQDFRLRLGESPTASPVRGSTNGGSSNAGTNNDNIVYDNPTVSPFRALHHETRYLFKTWADISRFVDICLMSVAASIAIFSPIALFVIMPGIAPEQNAIDTI